MVNTRIIANTGVIALLIVVFVFGITGGRVFGNDNPTDVNADSQCLVLIPHVDKGSLADDQVTIPFSVKNNCDEEVELFLNQSTSSRWDTIEGLAAIDTSGARRMLENFYNLEIPPTFLVALSQQLHPPVILKPGESGSCISVSSVKLLEPFAGKKVFGMISARTITSKKRLKVFSGPFVLTAALSTPPWFDLGEKSYFSVTPDLSKGYVDGGTFLNGLDIGKSDYAVRIKTGWAESLVFPMKITNTTDQPYIAVADSVIFYLARSGVERKAPSALELLKASAPILKPGESTTSAGRCYITLNALVSWGYKPGDKIVAAVGGRIPNTNKIFECYSAPFELPPLPKSHQESK